MTTKTQTSLGASSSAGPPLPWNSRRPPIRRPLPPPVDSPQLPTGCGAVHWEGPRAVCTRPAGHRGGHSYDDELDVATIQQALDDEDDLMTIRAQTGPDGKGRIDRPDRESHSTETLRSFAIDTSISEGHVDKVWDQVYIGDQLGRIADALEKQV